MKITLREKIVLAVATLLCIVFSILPQQPISEEYEIIYLIFVVIPIAVYLLSDPERRKAG